MRAVARFYLAVPKDIRSIILGMFLSGIAASVFGVLYNLYLKSAGVRESQIGVMLAAGSLGVLAGTLPSIWLARRVSMKVTLIVPLLLFAAVNVVRVFWLSPAVLAVMGFLGGFVLCSQGTVILPYIRKHTSPEHRVTVFGIYDGLGFGAAVLGSLLSGLLLAASEWWLSEGAAYRLTLCLSMLLGILAVIPLLALPGGREELPDASEEEDSPVPMRELVIRPWRIFSRPLLWSVVLVDLLVGAGAGFTIPYLNLYLKSRLLVPDGTIGVIFALVNGGTFLALLGSGLVARRIGAMWTAFLSQFLSIFLLFVLISGIRSVWVIGAALVLRGALMNLGWPVLRSLSMEIASHHEQHALTAIRAFAWNLSWMVSSFFGGIIIEKLGYDPTIKLTALMYLFSSAVVLVSFRSRQYRQFGLKGEYTFEPELEMVAD